LNDKFYILSIDGGGLKGLIALRIMQAIEEIAGIHVTHKFDLLAGTSTGGLIVSALTSRKPDGDLYTLEEIEELYLQVGESVMRKGSYLLTESETAKFDDMLKKTLGLKKLAQTFKPIFVPAYDAVSQKIVVFKTRSALQDPEKNPSLFDVCKATSAIPPVFEPYVMKFNGHTLQCVDAGVHQLKNPALSALAEVWKHRGWYYGDLAEENIVLLSVSTGNYANNGKNWSTDIHQVVSPDNIDMMYITSQGLNIDLTKINYLRVDMNLGSLGFSLASVMRIMENIEDLSNDKVFRKTVESLLSAGTMRRTGT
jgi:patatin-like phospholipase/acyl hydrolase